MNAMSYIPRSSAVPSSTSGAIPRLVRKRHTFRVFGFIAALMLVGAILGALGTYVYGNVVAERLTKAQIELTQTAAQSDVAEDIAELEAFEKKMETAQLLLDNHQAPSKLFKNLELATKGTVQFTGFKYTYDPGFQALLELRGVTKTLSSVALQNEQFVKDVVFDGFDIKEVSLVNDTGVESGTEVNFMVVGEVDQDDFAYSGAPLPVTTEVFSTPVVESTPVTETVETVEAATSTGEVIE